MSKPTGRTFEIRHVRDFLAVPRDRLGACLEAFRISLFVHRKLRAAGGAYTGEDEHPADMPSWRWTDDGKRELTVEFIETDGPAERQGP